MVMPLAPNLHSNFSELEGVKQNHSSGRLQILIIPFFDMLYMFTSGQSSEQLFPNSVLQLWLKIGRIA